MTNGEKVLNKLIELHGGDPVIGFMPYKYSMWDSMRTVYEAAVLRGIRSYILPLPYITIGDGKRHNEYSLWRGEAQDIDKLYDNLPFDFAITHYPYDGGNRVTKLDERYYTAKIRKKCKVVYLAYYGSVAQEHFIKQPGVENADYIFADTEYERRLYIRTILRHSGIDFSGRVFCVGGLPKYDMRSYPSGNNALIAGSLCAMIKDPVGWMTAKLVLARELKAKGRSIIFRPHPLTRDTIAAMYSSHLTEYDDFIRQMADYCQIDTSEDIDMAFSNSDYLYSDPSSVVHLWALTGRPYHVL